jgi:hypothetical protein
LDYVADSTGTWYIRIRRSSGEGEYRLSIDIQNQDDAASGQDAGKSVQEAIPLSLGTITGFLKKGDNEGRMPENLSRKLFLYLLARLPDS